MTPTFYQLLKSQQKMKINRLSRVMREGSPKYHYDLLAIAAGAIVEFDIETTYPQAMKYAPLDTILIINNDAVDIGLNINGMGSNLYFIVPAGVIRRISREELAAVHHIRVTNLDAVAAVTLNLIDFEIWRSPEDADSIARMGL